MKPRMRPEDWYSVRRLDDERDLISANRISRNSIAATSGMCAAATATCWSTAAWGVVSLREWVPLVTERELIAVASHTHFDHIGCHHEFECRAVHSAEGGPPRQPYPREYAGRSLRDRRDLRRAASRALLLEMLCGEAGAGDPPFSKTATSSISAIGTSR